MILYEKIISIYPELTDVDFGSSGTIRLENALDERGDYIAAWNHPTLKKPTQKQLDGAK